jgi:RecA-family ATPase
MPNPLPGSPDVERYLLGVLLRDAAPFPPALRPDDLLEPRHRDVAEAMLQVESGGQPADELTASEMARMRGLNVGAHEISALVADVRDSIFNPDWVTIVARDAKLRRLIYASERAASLARQPGANPDALRAAASKDLAEIGQLDDPAVKADDDTEIMTGSALLAFDPDNDPDCLIGRRWLCKGGSLILVGQAGTGKSSLAMSLAINLATFRPWFGITAKGPLRVLITQAENDFGDVSESFRGAVAGAKLTAPELEQLEENLLITRNVSAVGPRFIPMLEALIVKHRAQFVIVDPILSFCGIDVSDQREVTQFLRMELNPMLKRTGCVLCAMAHTPKPRSSGDRDGETQADLAYSMQGSAEWANYFREVGCLFRQQGDAPVFKLSFTKRKARSGMRNALGDYANDIFIRHAREPGQIRWEYATTDEIAPKASTPTSNDRPKAQKTPAEGPQKPFRLG